MTVRFDNIKLNITESEDKLLFIARKRLKKSLINLKIIKKSLDARDKNNIYWVYSLLCSDEEEAVEKPVERLANPPEVAVIGSGPAGLFCAVKLVEHGFKPIIIERGERVEARKKSIDNFFNGGNLNFNSNVQFGEGGAGTFSDGKLNTQTHGGFNAEVLKIFVKFGAPEEILYLSKPHVGSDKLFFVLQNIRKYIEDNGGRYLFSEIFSGFEQNQGKLCKLKLKNALSAEESELVVDCAVLALGHSARDTFKMLDANGVYMQPRDFAIGLRVEHLAESIGMSQYGKSYKLLPTADYKLISHAHERTVFTFCMCPGGVVIPAASEEGGVVTNGMSLYARDGKNSNSALMVQMRSEDWGQNLFDGMNFQRSIEERAFNFGGGNYCAPVQLVKDFLSNKVSCGFGEVMPTYARGTAFAPLNEILPPIAVNALKAAIPDMDRRLKGFAFPDAVLTGVETRFSSPLRIVRDEEGESVSVKGLYPCGEGSGYSGGITSSAADGLKIAEKIFEKYKKS